MLRNLVWLAWFCIEGVCVFIGRDWHTDLGFYACYTFLLGDRYGETDAKRVLPPGMEWLEFLFYTAATEVLVYGEAHRRWVVFWFTCSLRPSPLPEVLLGAQLIGLVIVSEVASIPNAVHRWLTTGATQPCPRCQGMVTAFLLWAVLLCAFRELRQRQPALVQLLTWLELQLVLSVLFYQGVSEY